MVGWSRLPKRVRVIAFSLVMAIHAKANTAELVPTSTKCGVLVLAGDAARFQAWAAKPEAAMPPWIMFNQKAGTFSAQYAQAVTPLDARDHHIQALEVQMRREWSSCNAEGEML